MSMGGGPGICIDIAPAKIGDIWANALTNPRLGDGEGSNQILMGKPHFHAVTKMTDDRVILTSQLEGGVRFVWNSRGILLESKGTVSALNVAHRDLVREHNKRVQISPA